jgi:hypothetical protein
MDCRMASKRARSASQAAIAGLLGALGSLSLIAFYVVIGASGDDGNAFGTASDLIGACASAAMIPVAVALGACLPGRRVAWTTRVGAAAMATNATGGPLLVTGVVPFAVETAASITPSLAISAWLVVTSHALGVRRQLPLSRSSSPVAARATARPPAPPPALGPHCCRWPRSEVGDR